MDNKLILQGIRDTLSSIETLQTMELSSLDRMQRHLNLQTVLASFAKELTERRNK